MEDLLLKHRVDGGRSIWKHTLVFEQASSFKCIMEAFHVPVFHMLAVLRLQKQNLSIQNQVLQCIKLLVPANLLKHVRNYYLLEVGMVSELLNLDLQEVGWDFGSRRLLCFEAMVLILVLHCFNHALERFLMVGLHLRFKIHKRLFQSFDWQRFKSRLLFKPSPTGEQLENNLKSSFRDWPC